MHAQDALALLAPMLRMRPELQDFCRFGGVWRAPHAPEDHGWAAFHIVVKGTCLVERGGLPPLRLEAGDVLLLPRGDAHVVYSGLEGAAQPVAVRQRGALRFKETPGAPTETELVCGRLHLESARDDMLLKVLPQVILLPAGQVERCGALIMTIRAELAEDRPGATAIARDLASALFVMLLRAHLEAVPPAEGLLALLRHRETARATAALLADPARDWSLDELAATAAVSRATLVRAFRRASGMAPQAFLTEVRLQAARERITQTADGIGQIAAEVGYQSEAALSRALHRRFAIRPGALRRVARAAAQQP